MAENGHKNLPGGLPLIATLVLLSGAVLVFREPLESSRPMPPVNLEPAVSLPDKVDAMLWQDPLEAALDHERDCNHDAAESSQARASCRSSHDAGQIRSYINDAARLSVREDPARASLHILLVMTFGGATAEEYEGRLRTRYALLTALRASGMAPEDAGHVQYFRMCGEPWDSGRKPLLLPFELFKVEKLHRVPPSLDRRPHHILVIWLPESAFAEKPLGRICSLLKDLCRDCNCDLPSHLWQEAGAIRADIIGPMTSDVMAAMIEEVTPDQPILYGAPPSEKARWLRIYSPWSTVSPALLAANWNQYINRASGANPGRSAHCLFEIMPAIFKRHGIDFVRMIGTDDLLALHIIQELERRGVTILPNGRGAPDEIVLISEWDSFYGKAFPLTFAAMMRSMERAAARDAAQAGRVPARRWGRCSGEPNWIEYMQCLTEDPPAFVGEDGLLANLHRYTYISGIDGRLPVLRPQENQESKDKVESASRWMYHPNLELPIGCGQLDYARRLAQKLRDQYRGPRGQKIKAIGVVGIDVYDRLILLHAIREQFPSTILFTTEIDARLLHHEQSKWAQNLLVFSSFELEPDPRYQGDSRWTPMTAAQGPMMPSPFPPFRDSYQTAAFLACRAALGLRINNDPEQMRLCDMKPRELGEMMMHPRIFEIGHGRIVDLTVSNGQRARGLHPPRRYRGLRDFLHAQWRLATLSILGVALVVLLSAPLVLAIAEFMPYESKRASNAPSPPRRRTACRLAAFAFLPAVPIVFVALVLWDHYSQSGGEPFSVTNGTSIWPGLGLWLIAILVGLYFVRFSFRTIRRNNQRLEEDFGLDHDEEQSSPASWTARLKNAVTCAGRHVCMLVSGERPTENYRLGVDAAGRRGVDARELWNVYTSKGGGRRRLRRSIVSTGLFLAVIVILIYLMGRLHAPYRGFLSRTVYGVFGLTLSLLLLFLLSFAVDAISLGLQLIHRLIAQDTLWPPGAMKYSREDQDVSAADLCDWQDIHFISRLTESIERLLYLPAILLLLIIAGRFPYFDNWTFPLPLVLTYILLALYIVVCAVALLSTARRARRQALEKMRQRLRDAQFGKQKNKERADRLAAMIEDVQSIRRGAFRPLTENPIIHFLLIPSGGVGVLTFLAYILPN